MNYKEQLEMLTQERAKIKQSEEHYFELQTESGVISIPRKVALKAYRSSIEHFKSRIQYQESLEKKK
jgi:hypothetical protein